MSVNLDEIRALAHRAASGPWSREIEAELALAARTAVPALCDEVQRLRAQVEARDAIVTNEIDKRERAFREVARLRAYADSVEVLRDRYRGALTMIQRWDCLNPPNPELLADLPWLRRVVDDALRAIEGES